MTELGSIICRSNECIFFALHSIETKDKYKKTKRASSRGSPVHASSLLLVVMTGEIADPDGLHDKVRHKFMGKRLSHLSNSLNI